MIGPKKALEACVNDMKHRCVHQNIGRGETPVGATPAAVRTEEGNEMSGGAEKLRTMIFSDHKAVVLARSDWTTSNQSLTPGSAD
jgi:hypothetical protein